MLDNFEVRFYSYNKKKLQNVSRWWNKSIYCTIVAYLKESSGFSKVDHRLQGWEFAFWFFERIARFFERERVEVRFARLKVRIALVAHFKRATKAKGSRRSVFHKRIINVEHSSVQQRKGAS